MYSAYDSMLVAAIANGDSRNVGGLATASRLEHNANLRTELERLSKETKREPFRVLDGRLQVLKRKGLIIFDKNRRGWTVPASE